MRFSFIVGSALLATSLTAVAEQPNINPGLWEYQTTVKIQSDFPIPDQSSTTTECVTAEDIAEGQFAMEDLEGCETTRRDIRRDSMDVELSCAAPDGTSMTMKAHMDFYGDSASGTVTGDMETPMGAMNMQITLEGRRLGDC